MSSIDVIYVIGFLTALFCYPVCYLTLSRNRKLDNFELAAVSVGFSFAWPLFLFGLLVYLVSTLVRWYKENVAELKRDIRNEKDAYDCAIGLLTKIPAKDFSYESNDGTKKMWMEEAGNCFSLRYSDYDKSWIIDIKNISFSFTKNPFFFKKEIRFFEEIMKNVEKVKKKDSKNKWNNFAEKFYNKNTNIENK